MKRDFAFRSIVLLTLIGITLQVNAGSATRQSDCISGCLGGYSSCINSQGSGVSCQEQYSNCAENCLAQYSLVFGSASPLRNRPVQEFSGSNNDPRFADLNSDFEEESR